MGSDPHNRYSDCMRVWLGPMSGTGPNRQGKPGLTPSNVGRPKGNLEGFMSYYSLMVRGVCIWIHQISGPLLKIARLIGVVGGGRLSPAEQRG